MMKWGRKKSSISLSSPSLINHVFPTSWLKKLKLKSGIAKPEVTKAKLKGKLNVTCLSPSQPANLKEGRFHSGIDDLYWRLSFGDEEFEVEKGAEGVRSICCDSDDELEVPMSSCNGSRSRSRSEDNQRINDMVSEMRKMGVMECNLGIMQEKDDLKGTKARESIFRAPNEQAMIDHESRALNRGVLKEKKEDTKRGSLKGEEEALQSAEKNIYHVVPGRTIQMKDEFQKLSASNSRRQRSLSCPSYSLRSIGEDRIFESLEQEEVNAFSEEEFSSVGQKLKDMKIKEIMPKNEPHRKSVYVSRGNPVKGRKVNTRIKAPRTAAKNECKIKAMEDMKKAKKTRKKMKVRGVETKTAFNSYAVVKSSFDPQQDFRDSMLEMIIEKGIKRPEELEELLVCYLTLNCGEYHDLIIKVFRQVWFELNQVYFGPKLQNECPCHH